MNPAKMLIIFGCNELPTKKEDVSVIVSGKGFLERIYSFVGF
jgi:hypothetical protein